jgi:hypothetical protein
MVNFFGILNPVSALVSPNSQAHFLAPSPRGEESQSGCGSSLTVNND